MKTILQAHNLGWWRSILAPALKEKRLWIMVLFGFSAGLPLWLIFSSLSLWLREAGIERDIVTLFNWAALGYAFKFVWAPLVDHLPIPILTRILGPRRSWILFAQCMVLLAIFLMSSIDPGQSERNLLYLALAAVLLGFSSATQDIVVDALRIEMAPAKLQGLLSSGYIVGYRIGMIASGAGVLYLASYFGSNSQQYLYTAWQNAYLIMAGLMLVGIVTTLAIKEPLSTHSKPPLLTDKHHQVITLFVACVTAFIAIYYFSTTLSQTSKAFLFGVLHNKALASASVETIRLCLAAMIAGIMAFVMTKTEIISSTVVNLLYVNPVQDFFTRYGIKTAILVLLLIGLYRVSDIVLGAISNVFYYDMGFTKTQIASVSKLFGVIMTILGGFIGGLLCMRIGVIKILLAGAILSALTNLLFMLLAHSQGQIGLLYLVISIDNLSAGLATAAFVAFLSALTNIQFTATQYALFTSLMTLLPQILGGYSGGMVNLLGYQNFFLMTAAMGAPIIILILIIKKSPLFTQAIDDLN